MSEQSMLKHLMNTFATEGWKIILVHLNAEREKIIMEGKANRSDEKGKKMWAALEGFDKASLLPEKLMIQLKSKAQYEEIPMEDRE